MGTKRRPSDPSLETRMAILEKKMYADGIDMPREVVEYLAYSITTNVRELEGALILSHRSKQPQQESNHSRSCPSDD